MFIIAYNTFKIWSEFGLNHTTSTKQAYESIITLSLSRLLPQSVLLFCSSHLDTSFIITSAIFLAILDLPPWYCKFYHFPLYLNNFSTALLLLALSNVVVNSLLHIHSKSDGALYSLHKTILSLLVSLTQFQSNMYHNSAHLYILWFPDMVGHNRLLHYVV